MQYGFTDLSRSRHLKNLALLDLSRNPLGPAGARALFDRAGLPGLQTLRLNRCDLGPVGLDALLRGRFARLPEGESSLINRLTALHLPSVSEDESPGERPPGLSTRLRLGLGWHLRLGLGWPWRLGLGRRLR